MRHLDPLSVDRELAESAGRALRFRRALSRGRAQGKDPFATERMGKTLFDTLRGLHESDPLRPELLRWVFALAELRIDLPWLARESELEWHETHPLREPREGELTLAEMTRGALSGAESERWHAARERSATRLGAHRIALWERRHELAVRMGLSDFDALEPFEAVARAEALPFLRSTTTLARELTPPGFAAFVEASMGRAASQSWPARLAPDTLAPLLGHADLLRSLVLDVPELPERFAPTSFVRAMYAVGHAFSRALAPKDQPFVIAHDRGELAAHTHGALFASLSFSHAFLRKQLGLSGEELGRHRRSLSLALLSSVRLAAVRPELRAAALRSGMTVRERHAELMTELVGREPSPDSALGLFRLETLEGARLAAWFLAALRHDQLVNEHDEDWFRSPRAIEQLREEACLPPARSASAEELARGRAVLEKALVGALSR